MTDAAQTTTAERPTAAASARRRPLAEQGSELRIAVMRLARRLRQERSETELSASQLSALAWISVEGPLTIGRLAELERVTAPSMNRTVNRLVDSGYVVRAGSPDDGRKVLVSTTEDGDAVVRETRRRRDAWLAKRLSALSPEDRATLAAATTILRGLASQ
jgi:DNA-binding MarR family transcriptional regulator